MRRSDVLWLVIPALVAAVVGLRSVVRWKRGAPRFDRGFVSTQWLTEHRTAADDGISR